jgi:hypothetical protein
MLLRRIERRKNGKTHLYWSVVENKCLDCGRVVQRHVLYLGDARVPRNVASRFPDHDLANARDFGAINFVGQDQLVAGGGVAQSGRGVRYRRRRLPDAGLVPEDRGEVVSADDASVVRLRLSGMRLHRPRQWGACWLAGLLWRELQLDRFWAERLPASRKRTRWDEIFKCWSPTGWSNPAASGGCIADGSATARWPICWGRISLSPREMLQGAKADVDALAAANLQGMGSAEPVRTWALPGRWIESDDARAQGSRGAQTHS